ncbi:type II CAAX prenyl endopeptidase Rce1 family protein [Nitrospirillum sp. BR 11828]|uniref:CPBP family glutamic-type intramembrane protease n=1 Tax=Nitrospirillum sp. BR 11828 TaxID=3104325 RepID=UPI002ACA11AF|nr:CPBP family glutamic-type intramembrane protease [Nitrospirillum sp. BR 11828]MDZ5649483.1 CPBP family glutamic-type intramembrane protease [Nitrospirillum sp. BR 11828]
MPALPWIILALATAAAWTDRFRPWVPVLLGGTVAAAAANGLLGWPAGLALALLAVLAWAVREDRPAAVRWVGHGLFLALAGTLSAHLWPGFHNPRVMGPAPLTPDAVPFTLYLNLDKPLVGLWLLTVVPAIRDLRPPGRTLAVAAAAWLGTSATCLAAALVLGIVAWAPKGPAGAGLWLVDNLVFVAVAEEALSRGYIQAGLARWLRHRRWGEPLALAAASALFGLAHAGGGVPWIILGGIAGIGYGLAYRHGGLPAAILAHVGLNATHFFLFTYPMLHPAA